MNPSPPASQSGHRRVTHFTLSTLFTLFTFSTILSSSVTAQDIGKETKANKRAQLEATVMEFFKEYDPEAAKELQALKDGGDKKAFRNAFTNEKLRYLDFMDIAEFEGEESAKLYLKQSKLMQEIEAGIIELEDAGDDEAKTKAIRAKLAPLVSSLNEIDIQGIKLAIASIEEEKKMYESELEKLEASNGDSEKALDAFLADIQMELDSEKTYAENLPKDWSYTLEEAMEKSKAANKPIHVVFSTSWCGPCKMMVKSVYPQENVKAALKDYIPLYIDGDKYADVCKRYKVNGFPTFLMLDAEGELLHKCKAGGMGADAFIKWLETKK